MAKSGNCLSFLVDFRKQLSGTARNRARRVNIPASNNSTNMQDQHQHHHQQPEPQHHSPESAAPTDGKENKKSSRIISSSKLCHNLLKQHLEEPSSNHHHQQWPMEEDLLELEQGLRASLEQQIKSHQQAMPFNRLASCPASAKLIYASSSVGWLGAASTTCLLVATLILLLTSPASVQVTEALNVDNNNNNNNNNNAQLSSLMERPTSAPLSLPSNINSGPTSSKQSTQLTNKLLSLKMAAPALMGATGIDWPRIGSQLVRQVSSSASSAGSNNSNGRQRWINLQVTGQNTRNQYRPSVWSTFQSEPPPSRRPWAAGQGAGPQRNPLGALGNNQYNQFNRVWDEFRNRLGARNTIRVHNAFRDFAWRLLSRLSMPTPVIYELRRQHFYPIEEDIMNDNLFNRNTSKTIRSKRLLKIGEHLHDGLERRSDDDDEEDSIQERLRLRLEDLVNLSRRSLFGRVVRLPSLFPFKRQQDDLISGAKSPSAEVQEPTTRRPGFLERRRKRKEADRQKIFINGKQYYINDEGELKEVKGGASQSEP